MLNGRKGSGSLSHSSHEEWNPPDEFALRFPDRFFDVNSQHTLPWRPDGGRWSDRLCYLFHLSSKAMDQLAHDIALQDLPVVIAVDRGALS